MGARGATPVLGFDEPEEEEMALGDLVPQQAMR